MPMTGAVLTCLLGLLGIFFPEKAAGLVGLKPLNRLGISEIRATYGGYFFFIGMVCAKFPSEPYFFIAGGAWASAAFVRLISIFVDNSSGMKNLGGVILESGIAALFLSGCQFSNLL